jgi:hypothetical protein
MENPFQSLALMEKPFQNKSGLTVVKQSFKTRLSMTYQIHLTHLKKRSTKNSHHEMMVCFRKQTQHGVLMSKISTIQ